MKDKEEKKESARKKAMVVKSSVNIADEDVISRYNNSASKSAATSGINSVARKSEYLTTLMKSRSSKYLTKNKN